MRRRADPRLLGRRLLFVDAFPQSSDRAAKPAAAELERRDLSVPGKARSPRVQLHRGFQSRDWNPGLESGVNVTAFAANCFAWLAAARRALFNRSSLYARTLASITALRAREAGEPVLVEAFVTQMPIESFAADEPGTLRVPKHVLPDPGARARPRGGSRCRLSGPWFAESAGRFCPSCRDMWCFQAPPAGAGAWRWPPMVRSVAEIWLMVLARRRGHAGQYSARAVEAGDRLQAAAHGRSNLLRADVVEVLSPACDVRGSSGSNAETPWLGPRPQRSAGPAADRREVSLKGGRAPDHRRMIVTLKTQAPRRLSQAGDFCRVAPSALCRSAARGGLALRRRAARPFRLSALAQGASFSRDRAASRPTLRRAERDPPNLRRKSGFPDRCATAL